MEFVSLVEQAKVLYSKEKEKKDHDKLAHVAKLNTVSAWIANDPALYLAYHFINDDGADASLPFW